MLRRAPAGWLLIATVSLMVVSASWRSLQAAALRNTALQAWAQDAANGSAGCPEKPGPAVIQLLRSAASLQPEEAANWRTLLRLQGMYDRDWVGQQASSGLPEEIQGENVVGGRAAIIPSPYFWNLRREWMDYRCSAAWDAWTAGLIEAKRSRWDSAVAYYQGGLGLALGRVPPAIVEEYYYALARSRMIRMQTSAVGRLGVAKYLALAGEADEARSLLEPLAQYTALSNAQRCEARLGLAWLAATGGEDSRPPPWPVAHVPAQGCDEVAGAAALADDNWIPRWQFAQPSESEALPRQLLGLDLDLDVLDGGLEILGLLYWQAADGRIEIERFRQPNLWPNSGNSWLPLEGLWTCLPGYYEPDWVSPCGSQVSVSPLGVAEGDPIGYLYVPGGGPDTYVATASVPVPAGQPMVYGGLWSVEGDFPSGQLARSYISGEPPLYYESILDLSVLPSAVWTPKAELIPPLPADYDFSGWIRPQVDVGQGGLGFDNVFAFVLPGRTAGR